MATFQMKLAEDKKSTQLEMADGPATLTTEDVEDLIRQLALMRASMLPEVKIALRAGLKHTSLGARRYYVVPDELPTQVRLFLIHPGFGWIWMPLGREHVETLCGQLQEALQNLPKLQ